MARAKHKKQKKERKIDRILYPILSVMFLLTMATFTQNIVTQWNTTAGAYDKNTEMVTSMSKNMARNMDLVVGLFEDEAVKKANQVLVNIENYYDDNKEDLLEKDLSEFMNPVQDVWLDINVLDNNAQILNQKEVSAEDSYKLGDIRGARNFADEIVKQDELNGNWITISTQTDVVIKYVYKTTSDNKYIIEIAANIITYNSDIESYDIESYTKDLVRYFDVVDLAYVFNSEGFNTTRNEKGEAQIIPDEWRDIFDEALETKKEVTQSKKAFGGYSKSLWAIPVSSSISSENYVFYNYVLIISFDNHTEMNYFYTQAGMNLFVSLLAIVVVLIVILRNTTQYLNPLSSLAGSINYTAAGDYDKPARVHGAKKMRSTIREFNELILRIKEAIQMREDAYFQTLNALVSAIDASDPYTGGHCDRVMKYCLLLGEKINLSPDKMRILKFGSILHDVGKIGIDNGIVNKPGKLTEEEYKTIRTHPSIGLGILKNIEYLNEAHHIMEQHHEKWDGTGYPKKLKGEEIDILSRIVALADTYDAMNSRRSYRDVLDRSVIIAELERCAGTQFDPKLTALFIDIINKGLVD